MADRESTELQTQDKKELVTREEQTVPDKYFVPNTDIYETPESLILVMEMPGVEKSQIEVNIDDDVLEVEGRIEFGKYRDMQPVYTEYNVGHFTRKFSLSNRVDRERISAEVNDGVLTLNLPKVEPAKARKIEIR